MKIKRKIHKNLFFLTSVILFFFLFFFLNYSNFKINTKQTLLIFFKEPLLDKKNNIDEIRYIPNLILNKFNKHKNFNKLFIEVDFKNLLKIKKDRSEALKKGVLLNNRQTVSAKIILMKRYTMQKLI